MILMPTTPSGSQEGSSTTTSVSNSITGQSSVANYSSQVVYDRVISVNGLGGSITVSSSSLTVSASSSSVSIELPSVVPGSGFKTSITSTSSPTVGTSPYSYKNSSASNQQVLIVGGTISSISFTPSGGSAITINITTSQIILRVGDSISITYTVAPTLTVIQL
jgi:hypothetical protein